MKKLLLVSLLAAATTVLACNSSEKAAPAAAPADGIAPAAADGQPKQTRIHFTNNYHKGTNPGQYDTNCIGIVTTEQIKADKKQKIMWKISLINGESRDDECTGLTDLSSVNLRFENLAKHFNWIRGQWPQPNKHVDLTYRGFPGELRR